MEKTGYRKREKESIGRKCRTGEEGKIEEKRERQRDKRQTDTLRVSKIQRK